MDAKRRRNGALLAASGLTVSVVGLVALTVTDPVASRSAGEPRVWAVAVAFFGLALLIPGLAMRKTEAPPARPPTKPRAYWLILVVVGVAMLAGTAVVSEGSTDWSLYLPGAYLVAGSLGSWLYEYARARRGRRDRELHGEEPT